jgi:hypothetical protein
VKFEHDAIEEAVNRAAKDLAEDIDFDVLASLYKDMGWTEVEFSPRQSQERVAEIKEWLDKNCKGYKMSRGKRFLFEDKKEAAWFMMRWL